MDQDEVERGWVIARRMHGDQGEQEFAYKLFLPTWRPFIGGGSQGTLVPVSEDSFHPGEGGCIALATTLLALEWDLTPEAWVEANRWRAERDRAGLSALKRSDRRFLAQLSRGRSPDYPFDAGPWDGPVD
ncbi:hypothetical protein [Clavibacter michiganensis]|uniref:hypothetical protein n=1 Tax=Clavibacter michiganensis TaxID=28447 RepID=UPI001185C85F|nr:hypothetical protein [Clavibacter michiganensis]